MYKPAPPRRKKTHICRSRTGCQSCRQRRKKCDEIKPSCSNCVKLGRRCEPVPPAFEFRSVDIQPIEAGKQKHESREGLSSSINITFFVDDSLQHRRTPSSKIPVPPISTHSPRSLESLDPASPRGTGKTLDTDHLWDSETECGQNFESLPDTPDTLSHLDSSSRGTQLEPEHMGYSCMRMTPALAPYHDYSRAIAFYMNMWRDHCLPALHLSFHRIEAICGHSRLITDTMATLSACRLSRATPQRKLLRASRASSLCFRPDAGHECLSGELYGSALRQMSWWSDKELDSHPIVALTVLVLFCYLESSMGNFKEFQIHSTALEKLLTSYSDHLTSSGAGLLAAWIEVKMQNWWRRAYFSVPAFYQDWSVPLLDPLFKNMATMTVYRRASVLWTLCESHRLSTAAIIACFQKKHMDRMMQPDEISLFESVTGTIPEQNPSKEELIALMRAHSENLDEWHTSLQDSELPEIMEDQNLGNAIGMGIQKPEDAAICFKSHILAMNFAYYVTARVMQCTEPLQSLGSTSLADIENPYEKMEAWIQILLRIAAGINWNDCVRLNVYTIGFAGLLLACAIRSRKLATGLWIQAWLEERLAENGFEEGNFPVFQVLDAVQVVNRERRDGRDVISLFQTVDDEGGSGKFGSYSSQVIKSFLVYARCSITGNLYSYHVFLGDVRPIPESH